MKAVSKTQRRTCIMIASALLAFSSISANAEVPAVGTNPPAAAVACAQCGIVENMREITQEGETTGLGTVAGSLIGGILGRQLGQDGSTLGMLFGLAGGAYAGNKFEQYRNKTTRYEVTVRMDDGTQRMLTYDSRPVWQVGERVQFGSGGLARTQPPRPEATRMAYGTSI